MYNVASSETAMPKVDQYDPSGKFVHILFGGIKGLLCNCWKGSIYAMQHFLKKCSEH